jgi:hypothetical protein
MRRMEGAQGERRKRGSQSLDPPIGVLIASDRYDEIQPSQSSMSTIATTMVTDQENGARFGGG